MLVGLIRNREVRTHLNDIRKEFGLLTMIVALLYGWVKKRHTFLDAIVEANDIREWEHKMFKRIKRRFRSI